MEAATEMKQTDYFVSVDWGTSRLRLYLVEAGLGQIVAEVNSGLGIKQVYQRWQEEYREHDRIGYYLSHLLRPLQMLERDSAVSLDDVTVILSGMASSSIGLLELPYASLPFSLADIRLPIKEVHWAETGRSVYLCSGLARSGDVMRGEEIQTIGWYHQEDPGKESCVLVLPGTHSKHIHIDSGSISNFATYMTGELFEVISHHTILRASLEQESRHTDWSAFRQGVNDVRSAELTHLLFRIRALGLQQTMSPVEASSYLSGLLIGSEVRHITSERIFLTGDETLSSLYREALLTCLGEVDLQLVSPSTTATLAVQGQWRLWQQGHFSNHR